VLLIVLDCAINRLYLAMSAANSAGTPLSFSGGRQLPRQIARPWAVCEMCCGVPVLVLYCVLMCSRRKTSHIMSPNAYTSNDFPDGAPISSTVSVYEYSVEYSSRSVDGAPTSYQHREYSV
jgi:hypothetical protein